ncbi:hypothetical protein K1719_039614 [Acacia pycnantha]|nr:hypothetical protein K1719_039614 [Acacia pycnantha]
MMGLRSWLHSHNGATNGPPFSIQSLCHCLKRCLVQVMLVELVAWFFLKFVLNQKAFPYESKMCERKRMGTPCIQSMLLQVGDTGKYGGSFQ